VSRVTLSGWGRTAPSLSDLVAPANSEEVAAILATTERVALRGLGRSYGDAAQLRGGVVLDNSRLDTISSISETGLITVGSGVSIDRLLRTSIPQGWFIPVTPGTRDVSIGGAIAADVHGKNHHVDGSFARHVLAMTLMTPTGLYSLSPTNDAELFHATFGAMGLTGVVLDATVQLLRIETDQVLVDTQRFTSLDELMAEMISGDERYRYSVAWVDCMSRGANMGRGILTRGDHATRSDVAAPSLRAPRPARLSVPVDAPSGLLNPLTIKLFNEAWFRHAPQRRDREAQSLSSFFHPLDGVKHWNRLYGRRGFVQYQFCVPDSHADTVVRAIERLSSSRVPSFLAVLKRFGAASPGPLSFPQPGWTLALDLPVGPPALPAVLDELDELVASSNGRVYLAKDARLAPRHISAMYPRLGEITALRARVDPRGVLSSDLAQRLELVGR
jgi:decaprenylphospho-beta-D-ribofuranose 2-oxidase